MTAPLRRSWAVWIRPLAMPVCTSAFRLGAAVLAHYPPLLTCVLVLWPLAGSVYACAWSPDGSQLVTSGGDKKLKVRMRVLASDADLRCWMPLPCSG
jgi:WD40 repeat protein